ncbi:hypothetical protein Rhopal_002825-T1 [Rhodotorula paludigena]|uniref:BTB domain-containing protein n=1 Tax=Rhodotorula paludigena TaxID=86838 RepID=A0AAV5GB67_9BASI|nr:hypothetical protein Rhopal_002825-T1 [Rhodotorula paludigena]
MSETLMIVTSDDPPVSLTAPRAILVANSKVFADLLSLPVSSSTDAAGSVDADTGSVTISETQKEIEPFLATLKGEKVSLGEVEWEDLARLSDKYDSFVVKRTVEAHAWSSSILHCFTLGSLLGDQALLEHTSTAALDYKHDPEKRFGASKYWDRFSLRSARLMP